MCKSACWRSCKKQDEYRVLASNFNEKWLTDVTEFKYGTGKKAYLSAILNLYDNSIAAYEIRHSNKNSLVFKIFDKVIILPVKMSIFMLIV